MRIQAVQDIVDFLRHKKKKMRTDIITEFHKKYNPPASTYKNLIVTQGFGHSGTGVIIDLLLEFDNTTVLGGYGDGEGLLTNPFPPFEFDFIRRYGGVFNLENICREFPSFYKQHCIMNFINLAEYYFQTNIPIFNDKFLELSYDFIDKLTEKKIKMSAPIEGDDAFLYDKAFNRKDYKNLMCPYLFESRGRDNRYDYYIKNLEITEYRKIAKKYLQDFFNTIESKENLVLDFGLCDYEADFDKYQEYVGDYKHITVYRDPRDVYIQGVILLGENWMPQNVEDFVFWYNDKNKNLDKYINSNDSRQLVLRFEELVLNYDESLSKILNFLNIDKSHHIAPKAQFRPEVSIKNIGIYKNAENKKAIEYIYTHLKDYCYNH